MEKLATDQVSIVQSYLDSMFKQDLENLSEPEANEKVELDNSDSVAAAVSSEWFETISFTLEPGKAPLRLYKLADVSSGNLSQPETMTLLLHMLNLMSDVDEGKTKALMQTCCRDLLASLTG